MFHRTPLNPVAEALWTKRAEQLRKHEPPSPLKQQKMVSFNATVTLCGGELEETMKTKRFRRRANKFFGGGGNKTVCSGQIILERKKKKVESSVKPHWKY
jgi:hypothetical protein